MLRIISVQNPMPFSWPCDPEAQFQPGMIAQLTTRGNQIVCGVSDGTCPIGIIDEIRTTSFTRSSMDEIVYSVVPGVEDSNTGQIVAAVDTVIPLKYPNIDPGSFLSTESVVLNPVNGNVTVLAGTVLNWSFAGTGIPDGIRFTVNYTYQIPGILGDDSTLGSGRITVWYGRMIIETDQYDSKTYYPLNGMLYIGPDGKLTSKQYSKNHPAMAIVTGPPNQLNQSFLQCLWL